MKMENVIVKASKRKKRRTRKNLDEIKKRTLQVHNNNNENIMRRFIKPKYPNCITNNRLTLAKKAIRSETVTRSVLSNLGEESKNNMIILPNTEVKDTLLSNVNCKKIYIPFKANSKLKNPLRHSMEVDNYQSPVSIILFSSPTRENDELSDSSSSAAQNSVMCSENSLYNEFMNNVADYVQESASDYFKTDILHNYKDSFIVKLIQNVIYNKNEDIQDSQFHMNKYDVKNKLSVTGHDKPISPYPKCQSNINTQYSVGKSWNVPSPVFCQFDIMNLQKHISSSSTSSSGQNSPEYFYYPHRLN